MGVNDFPSYSDKEVDLTISIELSPVASEKGKDDSFEADLQCFPSPSPSPLQDVTEASSLTIQNIHQDPAHPSEKTRSFYLSGLQASSLPVEDRLLQMGKAYKEKLESRRLKYQQERLAEEKASKEEWKKNCTSDYTKNLSFPRERCAMSLAAKRALERHELEQERDAELTRKPKICLKSAELAAAKRAKESTESLDVADVLMKRKKLQEERLEKQRREAEEQYTFQPKVTHRAKVFELPMTASQRLYQHAHVRKIEFAALAAAESETSPSFQPAISAHAGELKRKKGHDVYNDLYAYAKERIAVKREADGAVGNGVPEGCTFNPHVNPSSQLIEAAQPTSVEDHLDGENRLSASTWIHAATHSQRLDSESSNAKKSVSSRSGLNKAAGNASEFGLSMYDRQQLWLEMKRRKLEQEKMEKEKNLLESCSFRPTISAKGQRAYSTTGPTHTSHFSISAFKGNSDLGSVQAPAASQPSCLRSIPVNSPSISRSGKKFTAHGVKETECVPPGFRDTQDEGIQRGGHPDSTSYEGVNLNPAAAPIPPSKAATSKEAFLSIIAALERPRCIPSLSR